jgi:pyruvate dehydrogenase E1 component alpha subunit
MTDGYAIEGLAVEDLLRMWRSMILIRRMEESLADLVKTGDIPGPLHLSIGQEAVPVGVCANLLDSDYITSTHRGHGHFLAKGGDPKAFMAEIFGKATGVCAGKGGSMHIADLSHGILGANAVVGSNIPIAAGAALAAQLEGRGRLAVAFFGDGAANQGALQESLNIAALWKLPLLFICENNGWSEYSPTKTVTSGQIVDRGTALGVRAESVDGNNVLAVYEVAHVAVRRARDGEGPTLVEALTYRTSGHTATEAAFIAPYRDQAEVDSWKARDPIQRLTAQMLAKKFVTETALRKIEEEVEETINAAYEFALQSPLPEPESAYQNHMSF